MTRDDVMCLLLTLAPLKHPRANWSPGIHGRPAFWLRDYPNIHRVVWLETRDGGRTFASREVITHNPDRGTLVPTLERPTGFNGGGCREAPAAIVLRRPFTLSQAGEIIHNDVYYVQPK